MSEREWAVFMGIVVLYTLFAARLDRISVTMPMVFVLAGAVIGPHAFDLFHPTASTSGVEHATEITLALLLFADASTLNLERVRHDPLLPARLLLIGLPLTVITGSVLAYLLFSEMGIGFALLIAAILAPTDAALGLPIFTNPRVPSRIRRALNIESGLNDGIVTPLVTLFLGLAIAEGTANGDNWLSDALSGIGLAVVVGVACGFVGGKLFALATERGWTSPTGQRIGNLALAFGTYWLALAAGGNGFIAAFVGGLVFGGASRYRVAEATETTELTGTVLSLFVWTLFGAEVVIPLFQQVAVRPLLFAVFALTVARMVPVAIALTGTGLRSDTKLMMGWLGPRGLASVVFTLLAIETFREAGEATQTLTALAGWTILLSVILHAVSAAPLAGWYARRLEAADRSAPEIDDDPEPVVTPVVRSRALGATIRHPMLATSTRDQVTT